MTTTCMKAYRLRRQSGEKKEHAPVKPHDPRDRVLVGTINARETLTVLARWEVRALDPAGPFHHYFAKNDLLHLQLWNPYFGISLLTPSKLTADSFEAFPLSRWKLASKSNENLRLKLEGAFATRLPCESVLNRLTNEFREAVSFNANQTKHVVKGNRHYG